MACSPPGVLQLDNAERQAVDEHHQIRAAVVAAFDDRELVRHQPVVVAGIVEINQPDLVALIVPSLVANSTSTPSVNRRCRRRFSSTRDGVSVTESCADCIGKSVSGDSRVQAFDGCC